MGRLIDQEVAAAGQLTLTPAEVAARLGVSRNHVYVLMDRYGLPFVRAGKRQRLVPAAALAAWVQERTQRADDPHPGQPHDPVPQAYLVGTRAYVAKVCAICGLMLDDGRGPA